MNNEAYVHYRHAKDLTATHAFSDVEDMLMQPTESTHGFAPEIDARTQQHPKAQTLFIAGGCIFTTNVEDDLRQVLIGAADQNANLAVHDFVLLRQSLFKPTQSLESINAACSALVTYGTISFEGHLQSAQPNVPILKPNTVRKFNRLAKAWRDTRDPLGSAFDLCTNLAYQQIIGMGQDAVPLILRELEENTDHWFWALAAITGQNPVSDSHRGRLKLMAQDWISWARRQGYQW